MSPAASLLETPDPQLERAELRRRRRLTGCDLPLADGELGFALRECVAERREHGRHDQGGRDGVLLDQIERQGRVSLELGLLAFLLAVSVGVPLGVLAALRAGTAVDG